SWIACSQCCGSKTELFKNTGPIGLDQNIRLLNFRQNPFALRDILQVSAPDALARVERIEIGRPAGRRIHAAKARTVPPRWFDLEDARAQVGEQESGQWTRPVA